MRDDNDNQAPEPLSVYFGQSGMPEAKDLDACEYPSAGQVTSVDDHQSVLAPSSRTTTVSRSDQSGLARRDPILKYTVGVSRVPQILLGFLHINPFWVTQWFPDASQTPTSENTTLPSLTGYVLAFDKDKNERIPILTDQKKPNMLEKIIKPWTAPVDASAPASGPAWYVDAGRCRRQLTLQVAFGPPRHCDYFARSVRQ
jgi:hypothetical protein